jgi:hypothetical protein
LGGILMEINSGNFSMKIHSAIFKVEANSGKKPACEMRIVGRSSLKQIN